MILQGDALSVLAGLDPECVDMCLTSPPYWGLRDYGNEQIFGGDADCEHEWDSKRFNQHAGRGDCQKSGKYSEQEPIPDNTLERSHCLKCHARKGQLGLEPTPEMYIEHMTAVFHEVKHVLKKEGTLWLNIGDTYNSSPSNQQYRSQGGIHGSESMMGRQKRNISDLPPKCLCMIPERLAWSLIQDGWILRNKIVWYKPNGMPSPVKDRFTNKWEYIFMFSKSRKYYFDLDAVKKPVAASTIGRGKVDFGGAKGRNYDPDETDPNYRGGNEQWGRTFDYQESCKNGVNPGDVFEIPTQPFPEAHFAVFPEKLCKKPIKAGCPEQVCKKCGKARERISESILGYGAVKSKTKATGETAHNVKELAERRQYYRSLGYESPPAPKTIGWTSCDCNAGFEGGTVLDPFCGAGTVGVVAKELGRNFIGIDIKKEYCDMAEKRIAKVGYQQELAL